MRCQRCDIIATRPGTRRAGQAGKLRNGVAFETQAGFLDGLRVRKVAEFDREIPGLAYDNEDSSDASYSILAKIKRKRPGCDGN